MKKREHDSFRAQFHHDILRGDEGVDRNTVRYSTDSHKQVTRKWNTVTDIEFVHPVGRKVDR